MAYTSNENPGGLEALTSLAVGDLILFGDISDSNRAKAITFANFEAGLTLANQIGYSSLAPKTSPTFATSITGSYLTASELLITDGSKNIVSAPVATYPSLTELTYVKGVTSAIQTQMNLKAPLASPTFTGLVTTPAIKITTGAGTGKVLTSDADGDATWETASSGGATVTVLVPNPTQGVDGGSLATVTYNSNTTGYTVSYDVPFAITVTSIDIRASGTAGTAGTIDIGIYSEDGQTKLIDVTSGTINASAVYHTAVSSVALTPGRYYLVIVPNGTASVELNAWDLIGVNFGDTGEPVLAGTQTVTASTLPTTFNPSSDVTFAASSPGPFIRLNA